MKFRVTGQNKTTGARMVLEFESESKALAERKALTQGMTVNRVEDITDGAPSKAHDPHPRAGRRQNSGKLVPFLILIIVVAVAYMYKAQIMHMVGMGGH